MLRSMCLALALLAAAGCAGPAPKPSVRACAGADAVGRTVRIAGGVVERGAARHQPEERFGGAGEVRAFTIDATEVTNRQFAAFVQATGYVTVAERRGADGARIGAAVFDPAQGRWRLDPEADWRHPAGAGSSIEGKETLPVVAVAFEDAEAYARWAGRRLPSEREWEFAARGAAPAPASINAEAYDAGGAPVANTWQGAFPIRNETTDGFAGAAPVGCFPPNANGLYDMIGNVWEWTTDWFGFNSEPHNEDEARAVDPEGLARRVIKGGSHLCANNFCSRYRSGSRQPGDPGLGMSHIGFRTVADGD